MKNAFKIGIKTIAEQIGAMRGRYPHFTVEFSSHYSMKVTGMLQPTSRSIHYRFILKYSMTDTPKIKIVSPKLQKNSKGEDAPHLYPSENLCLYHPNYSEFGRTDFLSNTIIPWTSLWLYYYEIWHITGEWLGGGEHPIKLKSNNK